MITWDVLIPTIPHRHEKLCRLLEEFDRQWQPGFGVRVLRDNLDRCGLLSHGKRQDLTVSSQADYICFVDDDDWIPADYVSTIMQALQEEPDYVGFTVDMLENVIFEVTDTGTVPPTTIHHVQNRIRAIHSLEYETWTYDPLLGALARDISHLNPIRREVALLADWSEITDDQWCAILRKSGQLKRQIFINRDMYIYHRNTQDGFWTVRQPMPAEDILPLPQYPWLTVEDQ